MSQQGRRARGPGDIDRGKSAFFRTGNRRRIFPCAYVTRGAAERSITEYIEAFYNPQRRHSTLDYVSPMEFELKLQLLKAAAQCPCLRNRGRARRPLTRTTEHCHPQFTVHRVPSKTRLIYLRAEVSTRIIACRVRASDRSLPRSRLAHQKARLIYLRAPRATTRPARRVTHDASVSRSCVRSVKCSARDIESEV